MEVNRGVGDLALSVGFHDPATNLLQVCDPEIDCFQAPLETFPVSVKPPQSAVVAPDYLVDTVPEQTATVFRGDDSIPKGANPSIDIG
jgi:hypothetical protein